jgi:excisionase family DNA binding protein
VSDRVLTQLSGGAWVAFPTLEAFHKAVEEGRGAMGAAGAGGAAQASDSEPLLEADELASVLKLPVTWIEQAAREHRIPSVQAGRWRRFRRSAVERALMANGKT